MITSDGTMFRLLLHDCTAAILAHILDPAVPYVWLPNHRPRPELAWWPARVPLSASGALHEANVRLISYDLQLPTARFLELLPEFSALGVVVYQMHKPVPDSLWLESMKSAAIPRVLIQNGLHLHFYLPHAFETAAVYAPRREVLEKLLTLPAIRDIAIDPGA